MIYEEATPPGVGLRARAIVEYAIEAIVKAEVGRCLVIVAPWKLDLVTYLGDGRHLGLEIGYLYQETARGLPHAVDLAYRWTHSHHVVFAMPDTVFWPRDALAQLKDFYLTSNAHLALGVFPTKEADRLGPVVLDGSAVKQVLDKCPVPPVGNAWGAAIWGPRFSDLLHDELTRTTAVHEPALGTFFDLAIHRRLRVRGLMFTDGAFYDAGTMAGLQKCIEATHRMSVPRLPDDAGA